MTESSSDWARLAANASRLLFDPKFWFALYAVVQAILMQTVPAITLDLWKLIDALVAIIIGGVTGTQVTVMRVRAWRAQRAARVQAPRR